MYVVTLTQRDAAEHGDQVDALLGALAPYTAEHPFRRSWGDEAVGAVADPDVAVNAALVALRQGGRSGRRWSVGIGVGAVSVALDGTLAGKGPARSRSAVERCSRHGMPVAVEAGPAGVTFEGVPAAPAAAAAAEGVLRLLGDLVAKRTEAEWAVIDLLVPGVRGQQREVAGALGISVQAVSQALARAGWAREWEARPAASLLLSLAASAVD
ncbi:hypothetical protein [Galactobacter valiniphilus]|uniref:hypothetical protein n=1 Tax=Galactobacter valiniphilus TaxID=2676122 RepID=UPI003736B2FD